MQRALRTIRASASVRLASRRAFSDDANLASFAAARMGSMSNAMSDPVQDYRMLAKSELWNRVLGSKGSLNCLDVCSGTGRWVQAFSEMVLQPKSLMATMDCVDLDGPALEHCAARLAQLPEISSSSVHCVDAGKVHTFGKEFDLATNMHGLYAIPPHILRDVVSSMIQAVKPGGTCIITLGDNASFYVRYSAALVECGVMSSRYTSANDVADVLKDLGVEFESVALNYVEKTAGEEQLRHFLENESGGNTWPSADERTGKALSSFVSPNVAALIDAHGVGDHEHHFPQSCVAMLIRKPE